VVCLSLVFWNISLNFVVKYSDVDVCGFVGDFFRLGAAFVKYKLELAALLYFSLVTIDMETLPCLQNQERLSFSYSSGACLRQTCFEATLPPP